MKQRVGTVEATATRPTQRRKWFADEAPTPGQLRQFMGQIPTDENPNGNNTSTRLQKYLRGAAFVSDTPQRAIPPAAEEAGADATRAAEVAAEELNLERAAQDHFPDHVNEIMSLAQFVRECGIVAFATPKDDGNAAHIMRRASNAFSWLANESSTSLKVKLQWINYKHPVLYTEETRMHFSHWQKVMKGPYTEEIATQHRLSGSLENAVDRLLVSSHYCFYDETQNYFYTKAARYGLIDDNRYGMIKNLYSVLREQAFTLAAVGDTTRLEKMKRILWFFYKGFPPADFDGETLTLLCG